jgi:hypothetical protein
MTLTVTTIMGGLGRVVIGSDGKPALVAALGPMHLQTSGDLGDVAYFPSPTIRNRTFARRPDELVGGQSYVQSHNLNL